MIHDILQYLAIPLMLILFLVLCFLALRRRKKISDTFWVIFAVYLGFVLNMTQNGLEKFIQQRDMKRTAMRLLADDAREIYRWMIINNGLLATSRKAGDKTIHFAPVIVDTYYWSSLKQSNDFLLLASQKPFNEIFSLFRQFEKLNEEIKAGENGDKNSTYMSCIMCKGFFDQDMHLQLLHYFMSDDEIRLLKM